MKQSLDEAFCNHVVDKEIISRENIKAVKEKYNDICVREALLLEDLLQFEYYVATLVVLKEQELNKSTISNYWDKKFIAHIQEINFLNDNAIKSFEKKSENSGISFRELLLVSGILSFDLYSSIFQELMKKNSSNFSTDFDTSELEFLEKKLDSIESSLKKSPLKEDVSEKTLNSDLFFDSKIPLDKSTSINVDDASAMTIDTIESPIVKQAQNKEMQVEDASAMTIDAVESPAFKHSQNKEMQAEDISAMTIDAVQSPMFKQPQNKKMQPEDISAMTIDSVESPLKIDNNLSSHIDDFSATTIDTSDKSANIHENGFIKQTDGSYIESDASAMTIDSVEPPIVSDVKTNNDFANTNDSYFENDISAMTIDSVEVPIKNEANSYFEATTLENNSISQVDTAKTITSDISFSEYMNSLSSENEKNIKSPTDDFFDAKTTDIKDDKNSYFSENEINESAYKKEIEKNKNPISSKLEEDASDASLETLLETNINEVKVVENGLQNNRVETVEERKEDVEATLDMSTEDVGDYFNEEDVEQKSEVIDGFDASAKTIESDTVPNFTPKKWESEKKMYDAFPSAIVEKIGGLDEKTTNLTNLVRELRESQILQMPPPTFRRKYSSFLILLSFLCLGGVFIFSYSWINDTYKQKSKTTSILVDTKDNALEKKQKIPEMASFYYSEKQYDKAIALIKEGSCIEFLAKCYLHTKQYDKVARMLKKLIILDSKNASYLYRLARTYYFAEREPALILETYDRALELGYLKTAILLGKLEVYLTKNLIEPEESKELIDELAKKIPNSARLAKLKGLYFISISKWPEAKKSFDYAISLLPDSFSFSQRGRIHFQMGSFSKALTDLKKSIVFDKKMTPSYFYLGQTYTALKKRSALRSFNNAIHYDSEKMIYWLKKSELFFIFKKYNDSLMNIGKAIHKFPKEARLYGYKALIFLKLGNKKLAEDNMNKALELNTDKLEVLLLKSRYYFMLNNNDAAIDAAKKSIQFSPKKNWRAYEFLGNIYDRKNDKENMLKNWKKALNINPYIFNLKKKIKKKT